MVKQNSGRYPRHSKYQKVRRTTALRLAFREAGKLSGEKNEKFWDRQGKKWLAEGLGIKVQSLNHWKRIPRDRVMMVHILTKIPLHKLAPDLFKA